MLGSRPRLALTAIMLALAGAMPSGSTAARPGRFLQLIDQAMREAASARPGQASTDSSPRELISIWNVQGCGFTDRAPLELGSGTRLARIDIWYNWSAGEQSSPYEIATSAGKIVSRGTLLRDSCDPYQSAWCVGTASPGLSLPAGSYFVRTPRSRICQNGTSGNRGFIKVWGLPAVASYASPPLQPGTGQAAPALGNRWQIHEEIPGRYWNGQWTRRAGTNLFDAVWQDSQSGQQFSDVIELRETNGSSVRLYRQGTRGYYAGTLSPDRRSIRGTASWYPSGAFWTARITDR